MAAPREGPVDAVGRMPSARAADERSGSMAAVVISAPETGPEVHRLERPTAGAGEVLVRSHGFALCGSDLEILSGARTEPFVRYPVVPGHEWSGTVEALGEGVTEIAPGDRVVVEGIAGCRACRSCLAGTPALCVRGYSEIGFTIPGGGAEFVAVPVSRVHKVPSTLTSSAAMMIEPAAVASRALRAVGLRPGDRVAVLGAGALGLLSVAIARAMGAGHVTAMGRSPERLERARAFGAHALIAAPLGTTEPAAGLDVDVVIEAGGTASAVERAFAIASPAARVALTGVAGTGRTLTLASDLFVLKGLTVYGIAGADHAAWRFAIDLVSEARIPLESLITDRFPLDQSAAAYARAASGDPSVGRVLIEHESAA